MRGERDSAAVGPGRTRRPRFGTIRAHLVALVAIQLALVLVLIAFAATQDFRQARRDAVATARSTARLAADFVEEDVTATAEDLAEVPGYLDLISPDELCDVRGAEDATTRWLGNGVHLLRLDGTSVCTDEKHDVNVSAAPWFREAVATAEVATAGPMTDPFTGKNAMLYTLAVPDHGLAIVFAVELESIGPVLDARFGTTTPRPAFTVASKDSTIEMGSSGGTTGRSLRGTRLDGEVAAGETFRDLDGTERIYAPARAGELGWVVYAGVATEDAFAAAERSLGERAIFALVMMVIVLAAAVVIQRRFVRPIRSIARGTRKLADGDFDTEVAVSGPVELSELAGSFNAMAQVRKQAEGALRNAAKAEKRAADELRDVDQMRNAFLMAISHELRTPLTAVVGYSSMLHESRDMLTADEMERSVAAIASQSKRLERLLLDLLDVERISRGVVEPKRKLTDVAEVVTAVVERSPAAERVDTKVGANVRAYVDPALVERIIENLVSNAAKHTPGDSTITVRATRRNGDLRITVEDTGPGIPDDLKERVFEPFKQGEVPEHAPGTGVGLTLVAQFAKLHGGRAWVEDRRGGGASFRVEMPAVQSGAKQRRRAA